MLPCPPLLGLRLPAPHGFLSQHPSSHFHVFAFVASTLPVVVLLAPTDLDRSEPDYIIVPGHASLCASVYRHLHIFPGPSPCGRFFQPAPVSLHVSQAQILPPDATPHTPPPSPVEAAATPPLRPPRTELRRNSGTAEHEGIDLPHISGLAARARGTQQRDRDQWEQEQENWDRFTGIPNTHDHLSSIPRVIHLIAFDLAPLIDPALPLRCHSLRHF
ncbi:hypothetical protein LshimejAT787_1401100 [Lyophyllum shimeji]|uniref:Uncharacterized protein n=1 Tax=Lyophyllum shimeji TaxID=47721 RepID=A0A9P3USG4_LYOSH|nr:hypothetical protein LshimejAT787_1401100 [Lyophyllum shimeji]